MIQSTLEGIEIPEFELPNSQGGKCNIKDLRGKNVILVLFRNIH